jgi:3-oxoacyl-[acyl-carrier-protein] synthase-3
MAMENSGIKADEIDLILYTTQGTDCYSPGNAYFLPTLLGCNKNAVLDIRGQCSGFIQGLSIADSFIKSGQYNTILLVASELNSPFLNLRPENVDVACLFGDAAGAVVIQRGTLGDNRILSTHLHSDGAFHELLAINLPVTLWKDKNGWPQQAMRPAGFEIVMRGPSVFRLACKYFPEAITEALEANNLTTSGIDWFFMHQANSRIIEYVRRALNLDSQKVYSNIGHVGNTVSASIPVALSEAWIEGKLCKGQLICLSAFGSGLSWASAVLTI